MISEVDFPATFNFPFNSPLKALSFHRDAMNISPLAETLTQRNDGCHTHFSSWQLMTIILDQPLVSSKQGKIVEYLRFGFLF